MQSRKQNPTPSSVSTESRTQERPERTPMGRRDVLTVNHKLPGYVQRWINDVDNRLMQAYDAGWTHVKGLDGKYEIGEKTVNSSSGTTSVVSKPVGKGVTAYLMAIPEKLFNEDQAAKQKEVDEREAQWRRTSDGQYGSVDITRNK